VELKNVMISLTDRLNLFEEMSSGIKVQNLNVEGEAIIVEPVFGYNGQ